MRSRRTAVVVLVATLVAALTACGVPSDGEPREISANDVPFRLLGPDAAAPATSIPQSDDTSRVTVYFVTTEGQLAAARRTVPARATPGRALGALLDGVLENEAGRLSSAITAGTRVLGIDGPDDGLVTIDLSSDLLDVTGSQQVLAIAQVVFTATALPNVERVLFEFDGEPREVPTGEGKLTAVPLGRSDYRQLLQDE